MGIWQRIKTLFKSNVNDAISKREDPEKILNQLIIDMREQLVTAKKQVAIAIADEKRLKKQFEEAAEKANEWEKKAMLAVKAERDDLAVQALNRQKEAANLAKEYQKQFEGQREATEKLRASLRQLNDKIEEARRKKDLLVARQRRAEAQGKIHETLSNMGDNSAFDTFDRMAEKVDQMEAEAEAHEELSDDMSGMDLEAQFRDLESSAGADDALAALKERMGQSSEADAAIAEQESSDSTEELSFEELEAEFASLEQSDAQEAAQSSPANDDGKGF